MACKPCERRRERIKELARKIRDRLPFRITNTHEYIEARKQAGSGDGE